MLGARDASSTIYGQLSPQIGSVGTRREERPLRTPLARWRTATQYLNRTVSFLGIHMA